MFLRPTTIRWKHRLAASMLERHASKKALDQILQNNKSWVASKDPDYFVKMAEGQAPRYLFIGCSDSRINANEITGLDAGNLFVHRNIGMGR
jgi:carbonic anhydrase